MPQIIHQMIASTETFYLILNQQTVTKHILLLMVPAAEAQLYNNESRALSLKYKPQT